MSDLVILIDIAGRKCALDADDVASVIEIDRTTPVPCSPDHVVGLTALRSQALTVIDCRLAIDNADLPQAACERSPVVKVDGHSYALLVDAVHDVATARSEPSIIEGGFGGNWNDAAQGMVETDLGPALLVNIASLIRGAAHRTEAA